MKITIIRAFCGHLLILIISGNAIDISEEGILASRHAHLVKNDDHKLDDKTMSGKMKMEAERDDGSIGISPAGASHVKVDSCCAASYGDFLSAMCCHSESISKKADQGECLCGCDEWAEEGEESDDEGDFDDKFDDDDDDDDDNDEFDDDDDHDDHDDHGEVEPIGTYAAGRATHHDIFEFERSPQINTNSGDKDDFVREFGCDELLNSPRPIYDEATWMFMRGVYQAIVGPEKSSLENPIFGSAFYVPALINYHPDMGRGVFAGQFIKKGTKIWDDRYTATFEEGWQFRNFLLSIGADLACDVLMWSYVTRLRSERKLVICTDINPGSFINQAENGNDAAEANVDEMAKGTGTGSMMAYASRDIEIGEQLLMNYGDFAYADGWRHFGF